MQDADYYKRSFPHNQSAVDYSLKFLQPQTGESLRGRWNGSFYVGRVYDQLPLLRQDLDIVLLRPAQTNEVPQLRRQFVRDYRVRRHAIIKWLDFLRNSHPGYRDVQIPAAAVAGLPLDEDVDHLLPTQVVDSFFFTLCTRLGRTQSVPYMSAC